MRTKFFVLLFIIAQHLRATDVPPSGWISAPLVEILADSSSREVKEDGISIPIGHAAFQTLTIRKDAENKRWIVSGTVCSTNAGGTVQGAAIYAGYEGGRFNLVAMSNLKGEVLFAVSPLAEIDAKPITPTHLYIGYYPNPAISLKGERLRKYVLRETE